MSLVAFLRLFTRHLLLMFLIGALMGGLVFWLTRNEVRTYTSTALVDTGIFSGYNLESNGSRNLDFHQASAELDNLLNIATSFETYEELGQRLLAECLLLEEADRELLAPRTYDELHRLIPDSIVARIRVKDDVEQTFERVKGYCERGDDNPVYTLLYSNQVLWGIDHFSSIKIKTEGKSDMLRETYTTTDPGLCKRTLELHIQIYSDKQREIKKDQGKDVIEYFKQQLARTRQALQSAEDDLTAYMRRNKIINYYEQTRFIAAKREDLLELEFREYMTLHSADSTMQALERQMEHRLSLGKFNREIGYLRDSLATISAELAQVEWLAPADSSGRRDQAHITRLKQASERIKGHIMISGDSIYRMQVTPRGTDLDQLLFQWLRTMMLEAEAKAKLNVMGVRKQTFDSIYQQLAPVGSEIKRMERINYVHEQAYLENLHSLNIAIMHQQNMLMSTALNLISRPFFPSRPDPSSRKFLVVAAFLAGFVLTLGLVVALEYFDQTLKSPENAERVVGLEVIGALPRFAVLPTLGRTDSEAEEGQATKKSKKAKRASKIDFDFLEDRSIGLLLQNLKIYLKQQDQPRKPIRVVLISMRRQEGKSLLAAMLAHRLRLYNERVLFLSPQRARSAAAGEEAEAQSSEPGKKKKGKSAAKEGAPAQELIPPHDDSYTYPVPPWFYDIQTEEALVSKEQFTDEGFDTFITELPPLLLKPYPVQVINQADIVILVCRANRVWNTADANTLMRIQAATNAQIHLLLNGTAVDHLEPILGFIPKKRSLLRRLAKRFFTRSFMAEDGF
jgi:hypothetical protein